jgi:hypothetical protein
MKMNEIMLLVRASTNFCLELPSVVHDTFWEVGLEERLFSCFLEYFDPTLHTFAANFSVDSATLSYIFKLHARLLLRLENGNTSSISHCSSRERDNCVLQAVACGEICYASPGGVLSTISRSACVGESCAAMAMEL